MASHPTDQSADENVWDDLDATVGRLQADPVAWKAYQNKIRLLEGGSMDGLEHEPPSFTPTELNALLPDPTLSSDD